MASFLAGLCLLAMLAKVLAASVCSYGGSASSGMATHVLHDADFWVRFERAIRSHAWKCVFSKDLLARNLDRDARLYADDSLFRKRRQNVSQWLEDDALWAELVLGACREIAEGREGPHTQQLAEMHLLEALSDFVEHLNCFGTVAVVMASKGREVTPFGQDSTRVHDVDKLDQVMLTGYSERFEDGMATSVWEECVGRHTHVNPHHQAHPLWHERAGPLCPAHDLDVRERALSEMVCDKVSRRLQKELGGVVSDAMWDVDPAYFDGLPQYWLRMAEEVLREMKLS